VIDGGPIYQVSQILDIEQDHNQVTEFFATMKSLRSEAADCRTSWNILECLDEIVCEANSEIEDPHTLKMALKHCVGRLIHANAFYWVNTYSQRNPEKPYSTAEIDELTLPPLRAVEISH
jgi:hypothetical protein